MTGIGSAHIRTYVTVKSGTRYVVRYRIGGRAFKLVHAGSFATLKEARARREFVLMELAAGRDPALSLRELAARQREKRTLADWGERYVSSRIDLAPSTARTMRVHMKRIGASLGTRDPLLLAVDEMQDFVAVLAQEMTPGAVERYVQTLRQVLDFAGADPNPARDPRVRLPRRQRVLPDPPSASQVAAIVSHAAERWRLPLRLLEHSGLRAGELCALEWRDVDVARSRLRIRGGKTRAARRWVDIPPWMMAEVAAAKSADAKVFDFTPAALRAAMARACRAAGLPLISPHELRHRYISVKLREGVPVPNVSRQVGHSRQSLTLDVYSHVLTEEA